MKKRGWQYKLAKGKGKEQTLFEHSLIELDVLLELLPILEKAQHYSLDKTEKKILLISALAHDVGKETDAWQAYVKGEHSDRIVPHVVPSLTAAVVPELCAALQFPEISGPVQSIMALCANSHHRRPGQSDGTILQAMLTNTTDRFLTLANLLKAIDHFCSATGPHEAIETAINDPSLKPHLLFTSHEITMRGVSTTFLHHAAQSVFIDRGWKPLLYFPEATVYAADPNDNPTVPSVVEIKECLKAKIAAAITRDVTSLIVGSPTGNILPKPDLLSFAEARQYLYSASQRISPQSFAKKPLKDKRRVVEEYWRLKGKTHTPNDTEVEETAKRISVAQPEMMVFKFFKAITDPRKVTTLSEDAIRLVVQYYEEFFGTGSWSSLQSTSTLMPARDMANTIDYFWSVPGTIVNHPEAETVAELPDQTRVELLVTILGEIIDKAIIDTGQSSPRNQLATAMAQAFINDLGRPYAENVVALAQQQLDHYVESKPFAGKDSRKGTYLCPICNVPFSADHRVKASADFIAGPQTHSNRGPAHGSFDYIMICTACYYERLLIQVLWEQRPEELITLAPRLNFGPGKGTYFLSQVRQWVEEAKAQMRGETGNLEFGISLSMTDQIARKLEGCDPTNLSNRGLLQLFSFKFNVETQKERRREALKRLREEFDDDLLSFAAVCGQHFASWDDAVSALMADQISNHEAKAIRREVFKLYETIDIISETPNLIFVPLVYEVAGGRDESEAVKALRRVYVSLILGLAFDGAVAIRKPEEALQDWDQGGIAYIPPVPAVRSLIGKEWITISESNHWLNAIGSASLLVRDTALPARSGLYEILSADPAERVLRRIEERGDNRLTIKHLHLIRQLPGFHLPKEELPL
ncbi:MAG: hypothetical protein ACOX2S_02925 [bacterium]